MPVGAVGVARTRCRAASPKEGATMRKYRRLTLAVLSGSVLFQLPGCSETILGVTALASSVTAGGVIYLISKIMG